LALVEASRGLVDFCVAAGAAGSLLFFAGSLASAGTLTDRAFGIKPVTVAMPTTLKMMTAIAAISISGYRTPFLFSVL
jgi:hypothetical protein